MTNSAMTWLGLAVLLFFGVQGLAQVVGLDAMYPELLGKKGWAVRIGLISLLMLGGLFYWAGRRGRAGDD